MLNYRLDLVTAPTIEPVRLTDVKEYLRVTDSAEDDFINSLITVARTAAENFTGRAFINQTWKMFLDDWPTGRSDKWWSGVKQLPISYVTGKEGFDMPKAPLSSVTHIKTYDDSDSATTFSSSNYYVSTYSGDYATSGRITLREGQVWPTVDRVADGVEIQFVAGYGSTISSVPQQIRQGIKQEVAYLYENRVSCDGGINCNIARKILEPFRIIKL